MALSSGSHVKIGSDEFLLDESIDASANAQGGSLFRPHYKHTASNVFEGRTAILEGDQQESEVKPERLVWAWSDWSGGEGNRTYDDSEYTTATYDFAQGINPRIKGQITGRPNRSRTTVTSENVSTYGGFAVGQSSLWLFQDRRLHYYDDSSGSTNWTTKTLAQVGLASSGGAVTGGDDSGYVITAAAGDDKYLYYAVWKNSNNHRAILAIQQSGNCTVVVSDASVNNPFKGLCVMHGKLYGWTGKALIEMDVTESFPLAGTARRQVDGQVSIDLAYSGGHWADCVSDANAVFCFTSTNGFTALYKFSFGGGIGPVWVGPQGFNAKSMTFQNGVVFLAGHWGGDSSRQGRGALVAYRTDTRESKFLGWFRKQNNLNLQMQEMCGSYGSQIMVAAAWTGRVFVYDADTDGISLLDDICTTNDSESGDNAPFIPATDGAAFDGGNTEDKIMAIKTYGQGRFVAAYDPSSTRSNIQIFQYDDDEPANRQAGTATNSAVTKLEVGDTDFGFAFQRKILLGFHVLFKPLTTGQTIKLEYSLDGGSYSGNSVTIASSDTDASKGRTYLSVSDSSSTQRFGRFRWRITLTGTSSNLPPIVYNVTTECTMLAYDEFWDLYLRLKDESPGTRSSKHMYRGSNARGRLFAAWAQRKVLTFLDGYPYRRVPGPTKYDTYSVVIDEIEDIIQMNGEGTCKIRLRAIPV